ncbi:GntR family transcriptional regulator [Enemella dayhoffiae]|uniref:GntR family transcriptional regulator n=1 Tax=Enemella dayhoffiae TaxID=2016507 RepID=A0A255H2Q5_9ACTN|nr:GntR family transcriptional regulator [Enemella dayhoffiae]OYO20944.1 GntR family transcriptional regulator [Enemella dayhoffiae]
MTVLGPIQQVSTAELIAGQLREAIATGEYAPGQQVSEQALAERLGVSRGPLREAMQRLTQEGLLTGQRNRGLFVMELDAAAVRDIYLARTAIERQAVAHLIETGRSASADALAPLERRMAQLESTDPAISDTDLEYHRLLVGLTESPRLIRMHDSLLLQLRLCLTAMQPTYDSSEHRVKEHGDLFRAVVAGDLELADRLLVAHMRDGQRRVLEVNGWA